MISFGQEKFEYPKKINCPKVFFQNLYFFDLKLHINRVLGVKYLDKLSLTCCFDQMKSL